MVEATEKARNINQNQDLSSIEVALLDELFQGSRPVLTGVDSDSTYCFLLEAVEHRDEDTWGYYLLEAERNDILSLAGEDYSTRIELMNFIIEELQLREDQKHKGIRAIRVALSNQKTDLLGFAGILDQKLASIAQKFQIAPSQVRSVC